MDFYVRIYALVLLQENQIDTCLYKTIADRCGRSFPISHIYLFSRSLPFLLDNLNLLAQFYLPPQLFDSLIKHVSLGFLGKS